MRRERYLLKGLLALYILLTLIFAGLNYGYAPAAPPAKAAVIHHLWELFENEFKVLLILIALLIGIRGRFRSEDLRGRNRRSLLFSFLAAALVVHLFLAAILKNRELYFVVMPLPWSTAGLQLQATGTLFGTALLPRYGSTGVKAMLVIFWGANLAVLAGTLIQGRRFQCCRVCLFNGFVAELFDGSVPLAACRSDSRVAPVPDGVLRVTGKARVLFFGLSIGFTLVWVLSLLFPGSLPQSVVAIAAGGEEYKYLFFDLLAMLLFWIILGPRTYCQYCPAGTAAGLIGRYAARQRIETEKSRCLSCGACNRHCPMGLDPMAAARDGAILRSSRCLGCRRCEESCPTGALTYRAGLIHWQGFPGKREHRERR